jgi:hypothetical protein
MTIAKMEKKPIEIARSFSTKVNLGNYENVDIFCSAKTEADKKDFVKVSQELYDLCRSEVEKDKFSLQSSRAPKGGGLFSEEKKNKSVRAAEIKENNFEANDHLQSDLEDIPEGITDFGQ